MRKENDHMNNWLQTYTLHDLSEEKMEKLIENGKNYMDSADFNRNSFRTILVSQIQYLPRSFWVVQTIIITAAAVAICRLGYLKVPLYYPFTMLMIMIPLLLLLSAREVSKSAIYDMWEIEQSSRCQLVKITACRMVIAGLFDMFFLTVVLALISYSFKQPLLRMILYGAVPFNVSCICYLRTIMRGEKGEVSYHLIACMICISFIFSLVMRQPGIFEASMIGGWIVLYMVSVFLLGKTIQKYLQHEKMLGELVWNLQ